MSILHRRMMVNRNAAARAAAGDERAAHERDGITPGQSSAHERDGIAAGAAAPRQARRSSSSKRKRARK